MTSDDAAQDFARIMAEIRSQLTGDRDHDGPLLMKCSDRYREHPLAREILREIGRMLVESLPQDARDRLEKSIADVYGPLKTGLADAVKQAQSGDMPGARRSLEAVIEEFDPSGDTFADDAVTEYRSFHNDYEAALYRTLFHPSREVRAPGYDIVHLYLQYGAILVELGDFEAAESALRRANSFNPVNTDVLFELAEVLKVQRRWKEFHELSMFALSVSFGSEQAARAYRNLGFYYIEQGNYELAAVCYLQSGHVDEQSISRCAHQLMYIEQQTGKSVPALPASEIEKILEENGIQVGTSAAVREAIAEVDGQGGIELKIFEAVHEGLMASNVSSGEPEDLAALLLSCAGPYRGHPQTPKVVRRIGWNLAGDAPADLRAKLCLAVTRLAERETADASEDVDPARSGLAFIRELFLRATHSGVEGIAEVVQQSTCEVVARYDFTDGSLIYNQDVVTPGSNLPSGWIRDATQLLLTYVGEVSEEEN